MRPWLVVDPETGKCVGVISRRDMLRFQGEIAGRQVAEAMSVPPICVREQAHVAEAAGVMLNLKVHRLPVVNDRNVPVGWHTN